MAVSLKAAGAPTKEFFVEVLGRDIQLVDAIVDLVDNSVDGARQVRKPSAALSETGSFDDLWIELEDKSKIVPYPGQLWWHTN